MYKSLFVAFVNQLSTDETRVFLSLLDTLNRPNVQPEITAYALEEISHNLEFNLQVYAIPWLARTALSSSGASQLAREVLTEICTAAEKKEAMGLAEALDSPNLLYSRLTDLRSLPGKADLQEDGYFDLSGRIDIVMALSVLPLLPKDIAAKAVENENVKYTLLNALSGCYGRYALLLAAEALYALDMPQPSTVCALITEQDCYWDQPDFIRILLIGRYAENDAKAIAEDALTDSVLKRNFLFNNGCWLFTGRDDVPNEREYIPQVKMLWNYEALHIAVMKAMENDQLVNLAKLLCQHWKDARDQGKYLSTPWMCRGSAVYSKERMPLFKEYPRMNHQSQLLKACLSMPLIALLTAAMGKDLPSFLGELNLNLYDYFSGPTLKQYIREGSLKQYIKDGKLDNARHFSLPAIALAAYAAELTDEIGKGYLNEAIPQMYYDLIEQKSLPILSGQAVAFPEQEIFLHSGASIIACAFLAKEQASGLLPGLRKSGYWLADGEESLARKVCRIALTDFWRFHKQSGLYSRGGPEGILSPPIMLLYEHFHEDITALGLEVKDWLAAYIEWQKSERKQGGLKLQEQTMLLREYTDKEWKGVPVKLPGREDNAYRYFLAALAHKVLAVFRGGGELDQEDRQDLNNLVEAILKIYESEKYTRSLRFYCTEILESVLSDSVFYMLYRLAKEQGSQTEKLLTPDARDIGQVLTETIVDTSRNAIFYQYATGKVLIEKRLRGIPATANFLRTVYFFMLLCQQMNEGSQKNRLNSAYQRHEYIYSMEGRDLILPWFLANIGDDLAKDRELRLQFEQILEKLHGRDAACHKITLEIQRDRIIMNAAPITDERWFAYWDPDTLCAAESPNRSITAFAWQDGDMWKPLERSFIDFLVEESPVRHEEYTARIVLIEENSQSVLVSSKPGYNYRLNAEYWEPESLARIHEKAEQIETDMENASPCGLYLFVRVCLEKGGAPRLHLVNIQDDNQQYADLFYQDESLGPGTISQDRIIHRKGYEIKAQARLFSAYMIAREGAWSIIHQRTKSIWLYEDKDYRKIKCRPDDIKETLRFLLGKLQGKIVDLEYIAACSPHSDKQQSLQAYTNMGIPVFIASDSVGLSHYRITHPISRSKALITYVTNCKWGEKANGVVWAYKPGEKMIIQYLDDHDAISELSIEPGTLGVDENSVWPGMPVIVKDGKAESAQYLNGTTRAKRIVTRRLWTLEKREGNAIVGENAVYIGRYYLPGNSEAVYLVQDIFYGKLLAYSQDLRSAPLQRCGIDLVRGKAVVKASFPTYDLIEFRQNNQILYGEAEKGLFSRAPLRCGQVNVRLEAYQEGDKTLYDIHRLFEKPQIEGPVAQRMEKTAAAQPVQQQRLAQRYLNAYQTWLNGSEWLVDNRMHAEGKVASHTEGLYFKPLSPECFPVDPKVLSDQSLSAWTPEIPLVLSHPHLLDQWRQGTVYAHIRETESGRLAAFPEETAAFTLESFQLWLSRRYPNVSEYTTTLRFLKRHDGMLVFEWDLGYHVDVPEESVLILELGQAPMKSQLFFGDTLEQYQLLRQDDKLYLCVSIKNYIWSVEHKIGSDTEQGVLQCVKVIFNKLQNTITTAEVSVCKQNLAIGKRAWDFHPYVNGKLREKTEQFVREAMPEGGQGYLLAYSVWDQEEMKISFERISVLDIAQKNILCLVSGDIQPTYTGNDFVVPFTMQFDDGPFLTGEGEAFEVHVSRRNFSFNESTLRVYFSKNQRDVFRGMMMVKIKTNDKGSLYGTLLDLPTRPEHLVKEWLIHTPLQHVVMGNRSGSHILVEIKPGVLCYATLTGEYWPGATGRLYLDENDNVCVEAIAEGDRSFAIEHRIVELLVMDSVFKDTDLSRSVHFTVAGLPHLMLKNQELIQPVIKRVPPRYGEIAYDPTTGSNVQAVPNPPFGYVKAVQDNTGKRLIQLFMQYSRIPEQTVAFHQLSFLDGGVPDLWLHIRRGQWHYHDRKTQYLDFNGEKRDYYYKKNDSLPILFNGSRSLRYSQEELPYFAFPPHELEEYGLPEEQQGLNNLYPIAGTSEKSLYIELMPGRIISLPHRLIRLSENEEAEGTLCTRYIRPGDMVTLTSNELEPGKPMEILLKSIRYGLRTYIEGTAYLPIESFEAERVELGGGLEHLSYPSFQIGWSIGQTAKLTLQNNLSNDLPVLPEAGSLVMIKLDDQGEMRACGFEQYRVKTSPVGTAAWRSPFCWLKNHLNHPEQRVKLFALMRGMIPLRVESTDAQNGEIFVSYPQQQEPNRGELLCCQVLGIYGNDTIVLRSGAFLLSLHISELIGVSRRLGEEISRQAEALFKPGVQMWVRRREDGKYRVGLYTQKKNWFSVEWLLSVDSPIGNGFLCRDVESQEWLWLPVQEIARTPKAKASMLAIIMRKYSNRSVLTVSLTAQGFASWLKGNASLRMQFNKLVAKDQDKTVKVIIASEELDKTQDGRHIYLCYERPQGNIYELHSELPKGKGTMIEAVCWEKNQSCAVLMPAHEIRTPLFLSSHLLLALHNGYQNGSLNKDAIIKQYPPLETELRCFRQDMNGTQPDSLGRLMMLCGQILQQYQENLGEGDPAYQRTTMGAKPAIADFIKEIKQGKEMTLPAALAISVSAWRLNKKLGQDIYKYVVKDADLFCCEEILLSEWLANKELFYGISDLRKMLDLLDLRGKELDNERPNTKWIGQLNEEQHIQLIEICDTVRRRYRNDEELPYAKLAMSLLYALQRQREDDLTLAWKTCVCGKLLSCDMINDFMKDKPGKWFQDLLSHSCGHITVSERNAKWMVHLLQSWKIV